MLYATKQFPEMVRRVEGAVRSAFPIESDRHVMTLDNLRWTDQGDALRNDIEAQKKAKLRARTFATKLLGDLTIKTKEGRAVDRKAGMVLVVLPHLTARDSYIVEGNEVQTVNQLRLRPGPYTRFTIDNNTETFINAAGGGFRVIFNRETGVFRLRSGSTNVYLYPLLKLLGVTDGQLVDLWGTQILAANKKYDKPDSPVKLYRSLRAYSASIRDPATMPKEELASALDSFFKSKALDPNISALTLKEKFDKIDVPVLLKSSQKAIALARGDTEEDDTESMAFKSIYSVEDFISEKLQGAIPFVRRYVARNMDRVPVVTNLVSPATFSSPVLGWFLTSEFTRYSNQQNPLDMASTAQLTTTMGEGGIQSIFAVTDRVRDVHPSQIGFLDPVHGPEGSRIGITGHLTIGAEKKGNTLYITVIDTKTGKRVDKSANEIEDATVAFHDQFRKVGTRYVPVSRMVKAKAGGQIRMVPARSVQYIYLDPRSFFSVTTNSIPFLYTNHANRLLMADRHIEQAVPLVDPEPPAVQAKFDEHHGYEEIFGKSTNAVSPVDGTVKRVSRRAIEIRGTDRKTHTVTLHDNYPLNGGVFLTDHPVVKTGDKVKAGQVVASNNFSKDGTLAIGRTLRTALLPYKGWNFEDGVVISESAAKKLTSEHIHDMKLDLTSNISVGLKRWLAHFPDKSEKVDPKKYDDAGIIKKGAIVEPNEVLIPAVERITLHEEYDYARLHKSLASPWRDAAVTWDSDYPGEVMEVVKLPKFIRVLVKTKEPMQVGDKLSGRYGGKGIISNILSDNEMYRDERGNVIDMLFNPAGIPGRVIPGLMFEGAAGKVAEKTGKRQLVKNFDVDRAAIDIVREDLKKAGLSDTETITDPVSNRQLKDVFVGNLHVMKLQHQVRKKFNARGIGGYTVDALPTKISGESAQNLGSQEIYALLASGALHFLRDAGTLKSTANHEYWRALQAGLPLPPPQQPFIMDKFVSYLSGAGINLKQEGGSVKALPVTDKEAKAWSKGEITNPSVVRASDLRPEPGGLFDKKITGGFDGTSWASINLETVMPNPLMERPIMALTGLTSSQFKAIMNGSLFVAKDGKLTTNHEDGKSHGEGLKVLLSKVDPDRELKDALVKIRTAKGASLDALNKKRRYLQALKAMKMSPLEAYLQQTIPVIPPRFRPIYPLPSGSLNVADPNHGYREILMINNQIKDLKRLGVDDKNLSRIRSSLYGAVQGLVGLAEPLTRSRDFKGFIATIKGRENKFGLFQGRVVRRPQDLSARSTVIPDPGLGLDEIGIPEDMGLAIYKPFIVRRLVTAGHTPSAANELIEKKDSAALTALREEVKERPVYMNRAPSLHKFNMLPFKPNIVAGQAINVNPLIVSGYNMDFDGDSVGIHVPVSEEARVEAFKKFPSQQIFAVRDTKLMHLPSKEAVLGIYLMTAPKGKKTKAKSVSEMLSLFQQKKLEVNSPVTVGGKTWTPGQALINDLFPADSKPGNVTLDKKGLESLLYDTAKRHPKDIGDIISKVKDLGNFYVTHIGFSFGLNDLMVDRVARDKILQEAVKKTPKVGFEKAHQEASDRIRDLVRSGVDNRIVIGSVLSGAFGKADSVSQLIGAPVAVTDHKGRTVPVQISRSYAEGHDVASYWATIPGARKGLAEKGLGTQETGALAKRLINTTADTIISETDCGTTDGISLPVESRDVLDRVVADGPYRGRTVDPLLVRTLKGRKVASIKVRSPLRCRSVRGVCSKCAGLLENGQFAPVGYHIGVLAGQAISEPATQLSLRAFHTQGVIGAKSIGFDRVEQLLEMPENVKGSATLAKTNGVVTSVRPSAAGGWLVDVDQAEHFVPKELGLAVKKGVRVRAGQKLSQGGVVKPQELLAATGDIHRVRDQIIKDLDQEYQAGGVRIKRNLFETIVKPMTDRAEVTDAGDGEKYGIYRGEVVSVNQIESVNDKIRKVRGRPVQYIPTLLSIRVSPHHGDDFVGKLMFERPHETLTAAPAIGAVALGTKPPHPISQYTFGRYTIGQKR